MIGTTGATIVILFKVLVACVLGVSAGGIACFALRRSWSLKEAFIDTVLVVVVAFAAAYVVDAIEIPRGVWKSHDVLILTITIGSVVARHFIRFVFRSTH